MFLQLPGLSVSGNIYRRAGIIPILVFLSAICLEAPVYAEAFAPEVEGPCRTIEYFYTNGCPHCAKAKQFINQLQTEHADIVIHSYNVRDNDRGLKRFIELINEHNISQPGVPSFNACGRFVTGFDRPETTGSYLKTLLGLDEERPATSATPLDELALLDSVSVREYGLPLFTIIIGLVDGFNPCAMWVLLFLLTLLVNLRSRLRILMVAGTFVLISGLVYFAFMAAWLNLFLIIGFSRGLQVTVGLVAIIIGTIHIKDYFAFKKGISLSIPETAKPGIYARMRRVIYAENLWAAMIAVTILAILVNMVELMCTAGLPAAYTQILTLQALPKLQYYSYLVLYNLAYIFDDAVMVAIVVYTLARTRLQEMAGRVLKLISGTVIVVLGIYLLFFPHMLI